MIQSMPNGVDSKFRLVLLIARRAEQLMRGARPKVESDRPLKPTRLASAEFEHDQIQWGYGAEGGVLETATEDSEEMLGDADAEAEAETEPRKKPPADRLRPRDPMNRSPRILLGVSGGIAAYKSAEVVRGLVRAGADVRVAMTRGAREFVAPLTFAILSRHEVHTEVWADGPGPSVGQVAHVALAEACDLMLVAPATAHTIAKLAHGLADDFLTTYALAHRGRLLLAPAMETAMWAHPAVRANVELLTSRGALWIGPGRGRSSPRDARASAAWPTRRRSSRRRCESRPERASISPGCACS